MTALALFYLLTCPASEMASLALSLPGIVECEAYCHRPDSVEPRWYGSASCVAGEQVVSAYYTKEVLDDLR